MSLPAFGIGQAVDRLTTRSGAVLPGTLVFLVGVGWLPLMLAVAGMPNAGDLAFFGAALLGSGAYPWNVAALLLCVLTGMAAIVVLLAAGEGDILDRLAAEQRAPSRVWRITAAIALACLPAVLAIVGLGWAVATAAPAAYANPDPTDAFWMQIARSVLPWLVALSAAIVFGQAFGATTLREVRSSASGVGSSLRSGFHRFAQAPFRMVAMAVVGMTLVVMVLATSWMVSAMVWTQLGSRLGSGQMTDPATIGLLVILAGAWMAMLLVGGTLQAFLSAWWSVALEETG